ncbi:MAG: hypothetical protein K9H15_13450 [Bacteroidales bacterium]|nr:hypothetical protein [Bacteroidales bacterium]
MVKYWCVTLLLCLVSATSWSQNDSLTSLVKNHPIIGIGGADVIQYNNQPYIIGVGYVENKGQSRSILERVGKVKAEKEITILINGSEFTSSAMAVIEEITTIEDGEQVTATYTDYFEKIQENTEGFIHSMQKLASWKSEDQSMFYYAIFKPITR